MCIEEMAFHNFIFIPIRSNKPVNITIRSEIMAVLINPIIPKLKKCGNANPVNSRIDS